jgi:hypothetical protein
VPPLALQRLTQARLPTPEGEFQLVLYRTPDEKEHLALTLGAVAGEDILVRIHSECLTGDVLGSTRCDCGGQLHRAMEVLAGRGVLIYLRQEGAASACDKLRLHPAGSGFRHRRREPDPRPSGGRARVQRRGRDPARPGRDIGPTADQQPE